MILPILNQALARSSDPLTSFQAAAAARAFIPSQEARIVDALHTFGAMGVDEIASLIALEPHAVGKRMRDLERCGVVRLSGNTVKSNSGRPQREWRAA